MGNDLLVLHPLNHIMLKREQVIKIGHALSLCRLSTKLNITNLPINTSTHSNSLLLKR
jgi:hypothetical protein